MVEELGLTDIQGHGSYKTLIYSIVQKCVTSTMLLTDAKEKKHVLLDCHSSLI